MREELRCRRSAEIRGMFGRIARRYDLLNRVLSLGRDVAWRRRLARRLEAAAPRAVLDVCTGTGDVALGLPDLPFKVGSDFCLPMLALARRKAVERRRPLRLLAADALKLPVRRCSVDAVTVAFGIRNFEDLEVGVRELVRVLRPGGLLLILEFSRPHGLMAPVLGWWAREMPPRVGRWLSGDSEAYRYLPASVESFPDQEQLATLLGRLGLERVVAHRLTGGVVTLYEGVRPREEDDRGR